MGNNQYSLPQQCGSINIFLEQTTFETGSKIIGVAQFVINNPKICAYIELTGREEILYDNKIQKQNFFQTTSLLKKPGSIGAQDERFSITVPDMVSQNISTNNGRIIKLNYFIKGYLNYEEKKKIIKQSRIQKKEQILIVRPYVPFLIEIQKSFPYQIERWCETKTIIIKYYFPKAYFISGDDVIFQLQINNRYSGSNIERVFILIVYEIIKRCKRGQIFRQKQQILERQIISKYDDFGNVNSGSEKHQQIQLGLKRECQTTNYTQNLLMNYYVEMIFEFDTIGCSREKYTERVLLDVVNHK